MTIRGDLYRDAFDERVRLTESVSTLVLERDTARALARRWVDFARHLPDCASTYPYTRVSQPCNCGLERLRVAFDAAQATWDKEP